MGVLGRLVRVLPEVFLPLPLCLLLLSCLRLFCFLGRAERGASATLYLVPVGLGLSSGTVERAVGGALDEEAASAPSFLLCRPDFRLARLPLVFFFLREDDVCPEVSPSGSSTLPVGLADGIGGASAGAVVGVSPSAECQDDFPSPALAAL